MFLLFCTVVLFMFYYYSTRNFGYWKKRNVKHEPAVPLLGTHYTNLFGIKSIAEITVELYNKYSEEKVIGYYRGNTPELIIRDPEIIRSILTADFPYFHKRGLMRDVHQEPMTKNLFNVDGDTWKLLRQRLTPAFTTLKLKRMFPLIIDCADRLQTVVTCKADSKEIIDAREIMARFTTDFIGACGFGIEMGSINNEQSEFRKIGQYIFAKPPSVVFALGLRDIIPELNPYIAVNGMTAMNAITSIFKTIREQRNNKPIGRDDFVDLILELESKGTIRGESIEKRNADGSPIQAELEMDIVTMAAQLFVFFAAGFETSSSVTSFLLHELAYNQEIQMKVQKEIDEVLKKYDNKLCYEAISEMKYLEMAFKEAMRLFPSLGVLNRECVHRTTLPGTDITLDPGVKIIIPIQALQNDSKYFDNPTEFRPERFAPEAFKSIPNHVYIPFGEGPRACIGERLGQMQSLAGVASLLHKFTFKPSPTSKRRLKVSGVSNVVQTVVGGIPLIIVKRNTSDD